MCALVGAACRKWGGESRRVSASAPVWAGDTCICAAHGPPSLCTPLLAGCPLPASLVAGLSLQVDADAPVMESGFVQQQLGAHTVATVPPPFMQTRMPPAPSAPAPPQRALPQPHKLHGAAAAAQLQGRGQAGAPCIPGMSRHGDALGMQVEGGMSMDSLAGGGSAPHQQAPTHDGGIMFNLGFGEGQRLEGSAAAAAAGAQPPLSARQAGKRPRNTSLHPWL